MSRDPEEEIAIRKLRAGDCEAFGYLVAKYRRPVLGFIFNLTKDSEQVEDIGQDVFLKAFRSLSSFDPTRGAAFSTWLFTIARNSSVCIVFGLSRHFWSREIAV